MTPPAGLAGQLSRGLAWACIALAPLPFGSVQPVWVFALCGGLAASLVLADLSRLDGAAARQLAPVWLAAAAVVALACLQGLPPGILLPASPVWEQAGTVLGRPLDPAVAVTRDPPWRALGTTLIVALAFTRVYLLALDRDEADRLHRLVALAGLAYAAIGIANVLVAPDMLLWRARRAYFDMLTGTFVNRNTAATYFGTCSLVALVLLLRFVRRHLGSGRPLRRMAGDLVGRAPPRPVLIWGGVWLALLGATVATTSRAGASLTLACTVLTVLLWSPRQLGRTAIVLVAALGVATVAFELLGGGLAGRVASRGVGDASRTGFYVDALAMIADAPWTGVGLGAFEAAFPPYRSTPGVGIVDKAHSTPLEFAVEIGVPATALLIAASLTVLVRLFRACLAERRFRMYPLAGLCTALLGGGHSLVDFSLQIPGYMIVYATVLGACSAQALPTRAKRDLRRRSGHSDRAAARTPRPDGGETPVPVQGHARSTEDPTGPSAR